MRKEKQFSIINKYNPFDDSFGNHTWIKSPSDVHTYQEVWDEEGELHDITPDFSKEDVERALRTNIITVYSSHPIVQGTFVTPSKMEALNYAGNGKIYSKKVTLDSVAWIDTIEGQYANINVTENKKYMKKTIRLTEADLYKIVENSIKHILKKNIKM